MGEGHWLQIIEIDHSVDNLKKLKRWYSEGFAKKIRTYFQLFINKSDFADRIKLLIPNKINALQTLDDNLNYFVATISQHYQEQAGDVELIEGEQDPIELARLANYELTLPMASEDEVNKFKSDFRKYETICTYNNVQSRIESYHILWLRHINADNILPADELTQGNLSPEWKEYLKYIQRYDYSSGLYNLQNLEPMREDPYGVSSMSVQISKTGTHVSIKNRYNLTVLNPDATLDNNLDSIQNGLQGAVFKAVGREDLLKAMNIPLASGYILDNNGGIHKYLVEVNNVYYGYYEKIENGVVTTLDSGKYHQISSTLYISKSMRNPKIINWSTNTQNNELEAKYTIEKKDNKFILTTYRRDRKITEIIFSVDKSNRIDDLEIIVLGNIEQIAAYPLLSKITVEERCIVGTITQCETLRELNIKSSGKIDYLTFCDQLEALNLSEKTRIGQISNCNNLRKLIINSEVNVGHISRCDLLTT